ncbi:hypothetical protein [Alysiella filiformis]|uniref:Uncharacterized protein n=1 Tax=Alysiella filiformis DSM 16848 TaxID=1120981 RepID=A0A286E9R7_9NEIS|nr:hypothetical protein [Alysiella filiformis]QMT31394.1 hypothetical protein H3L97_00290 [Alysiella filiformis]UBQ55596.1 hypothetical protein JF568_08380 [Alysiella filiformis DSM 16848]SOD67604.1 hypothetical protein SAMN02746062_00966 [Alysiella filiformis DSM 16848]
MSEEKQIEQGLYITGSFERIKTDTRKGKDGDFVVHSVELLVRSEQATKVYELKIKDPNKFNGVKRGQLVTLPVYARAYNGFVYYNLAE